MGKDVVYPEAHELSDSLGNPKWYLSRFFPVRDVIDTLIQNIIKKTTERIYDGYSTHTLFMREYVLMYIIYSLHLYNEDTHK